MSKKYKIGTRGSLLAVTQCTLIAEEMTKRTGAEFELIKIKTQGDQIVDKPLWQLDGKDFFTKELDHALLTNEVDLVVHSYKDLGSDRPEGIKLAAITERTFANDILLIKEETIKNIKSIEHFVVGTSSPRRIVNIESTLSDYLPGLNESASLKCEMLRGNVNTRIQKLKDGNYHAIVLALAGIERLAHKEDSKKELTELLRGLNFLILPQKDFPSSASQGALAIECNGERNDEELLKVLQSVHCNRTQSEVKREREIFQSFGGGCHLAVGINVQSHKDQFVKIQKGLHEDKPVYKIELEGADYSELKGLKAFIPFGDDEKIIGKAELETNLTDNGNYFITSKYCIPAVKNLKDSTLWASGIPTLKKLVKEGLWVNGTSDSLGHAEIQKYNQSEALKLMMKADSTKVLSHEDAKSPLGDNIPCYRRVVTEEKLELSSYDIFFWNSYFQFETYTNLFPEIKNKKHACGLGKTYDQFISNNIDVTPFTDMQSFKEIF